MTRRIVAIVGSRNWTDADAIRAAIDSLPPDALVISGGARGVDTIAADYAAARGLEVRVYPADWRTHGKAAGPIRNAELVRDASEVWAFWDGVSRGTADTIRRAQRAAHVTDVRVIKEGEA